MVRTLKLGLRLRCLATVSVQTLAILLEMRYGEEEEEETKQRRYVSLERVRIVELSTYFSLSYGLNLFRANQNLRKAS